MRFQPRFHLCGKGLDRKMQTDASGGQYPRRPRSFGVSHAEAHHTSTNAVTRHAFLRGICAEMILDNSRQNVSVLLYRKQWRLSRVDFADIIRLD